MKQILILGGYGNFGKRICELLAKDNIPFIIVGRNKAKAEELAKKYNGSEIAVFDVNKDFAKQLKMLEPSVVINTCGPFQNADYSVAKKCIKAGVHYIDLADARDFVNGIGTLKSTKTLVVSGASTVPGLSSAVLEKYKGEFSQIDSMIFGITPGQKSQRGLATTKSILTYIGRKLRAFAGHKHAYGWQDLYQQKYPELGNRWMANCEVADLDLLPKKYGIKSIRFSAGMDSVALHFSIWLLSWVVRMLPSFTPAKYANIFWKASYLFDWMGSKDGGMHVILKGIGKNGEAHERKWFIVAKENHGPYIPIIPTVILAKKLYRGELKLTGAHPCVGLITLEEYLEELKGFAIQVYEFKT